MIENLKRLADLGYNDKIVIRLPLIPGYNSEKDREKSEKFLRGIGLTNFDRFTYIIRE